MRGDDAERSDEELSPRQRQILLLASEGKTDRQIALEIGLGEGTVRTYWERIRGRLDARSRSEAIARSLGNEHRAVVEELSRLRTLLSGVPEFLWTAQPSGEVDYCNDYFGRFTGRSVAECRGLGCRLLMPENEAIGSAIRWRNAQKEGRGYSALVHFLDCQGIAHLHRITLTPLRSSAGEVMKWVGNAHAIDPPVLR